MNKSDAAFDFDRYRKLLAEANDEPKRLALINLLIDEKAKDQLAGHSLRQPCRAGSGGKAQDLILPTARLSARRLMTHARR